jgi:hypothetical protein
MRATRTQSTSLLAAVGAGLAVAAMIGAPVAFADDTTIACEPGQIVIDGNCAAAPVDEAAAPIDGTVPVEDPNAGADPFSGVPPNSDVDLGGGGVDVATGGVDIGGGGIDLGGGGDVADGHGG